MRIARAGSPASRASGSSIATGRSWAQSSSSRGDGRPAGPPSSPGSGATFGHSEGVGKRLLHFTPALDRHHDGAHPVALGQHELLDLARLELGEQRAEVAHRLADRAQLVGADPKGRRSGGHDAAEHRRHRGRNPAGPSTDRRRSVRPACHGARKMALEPQEAHSGRFKPFAYLATQNAALYRRVMLAFLAAKRRFVVHLRSEDVMAELTADGPADPKAVADALAQLVEWGNLRADPDTSRVT